MQRKFIFAITPWIILFASACSNSTQQAPQTSAHYYYSIENSPKLFSQYSLWLLSKEKRSEIESFYTPDGRIDVSKIRSVNSIQIKSITPAAVEVEIINPNGPNRIWLRPNLMTSVDQRYDKVLLDIENTLNINQKRNLPFTP